jgi:HAD superfamily hydrolase (TIGR01484 family)
MKPLQELKQHASQMLGVLTDIDDTLTTKGKLTAHTYAALHALRDAGLKVVPITGGPASLALHAARLWPVDAAIGESGAVLYRYDGHQLSTQYWDDDKTRAFNIASRTSLITRLAHEVPNASLAPDQCFRLCDLAINLREDLSASERLSDLDIQKITALLNDSGYNYTQSSIHLNAWLGSYNKLAMAQRALQLLWGIDINLPEQRKRWLYIGDAPNDEVMFEYFPMSVGVANIAGHISDMKYLPTYISTLSHGDGFAEIVQMLLSAR